MASTPNEWFPLLTGRLDARQARLASLRSYTNGTAPLPEMGQNVRESWKRFQRKARTNLGQLIIESPAERMIPNGVTVGGSADSMAAQSAANILRNNRWDVVVADSVRDMLTVSIGYILTGRDEQGRAVITAEKPEFMYAATDPLRPWVARAAIKVWRDPDMGKDYAYVWADGSRQKYSRTSHLVTNGDKKLIAQSAGDTWGHEGEPERYEGRPPVVVLENHDGIGEFEPHTDLIDRINLNILQRLVTTAMQAFRQRAVEGGLPDKDDDGNDIDWSKVFEPAPGALWDLPEGIEIWESQQTDITPMLLAEKDDLRNLCAVTRTPLAALLPDSANQSAEGAAFAKEGTVFKAKDRISRIAPALAVAVVHALRAEDVDYGDATVEILWEPPDRVSLAEKYSAAAQAKAAGESWKSIARNILGYSPEQIQQDALDRAEEQMDALAFGQEVIGGTDGGPAA